MGYPLLFVYLSLVFLLSSFNKAAYFSDLGYPYPDFPYLGHLCLGEPFGCTIRSSIKMDFYRWQAPHERCFLYCLIANCGQCIRPVPAPSVWNRYCLCFLCILSLSPWWCGSNHLVKTVPKGVESWILTTVDCCAGCGWILLCNYGFYQHGIWSVNPLLVSGRSL